jgi:hypothetical protein
VRWDDDQGEADLVNAADGLAGRPGHGPVDVALGHVWDPS